MTTHTRMERAWLALALLLSAACSAGGRHGGALDRNTAELPLNSPAGEGALSVGFLIVDGVYNTELTAPYDIFHHTPFHVAPGMRVFSVGPGPVVTSFEGLRLIPDFDYDSAPPVDVLVVPSAEHSMDTDLEDEAMLAYVRRAGAQADFVVSLCDGAFVLAAAGLLDGQRATTFPSDIPRFAEVFPAIDVVRDVSFVHDGKAITSAGGAVSFDASLYLVELLYGAEVARGVAGGLVIDWNVDAVPHVVTDRGRDHALMQTLDGRSAR